MEDENLYVVGIGASAGGLDALTAFFKNLKSAGNTAFVVVQHLKRDHISSLTTILSRRTQIPVIKIKHGEKITKGNIYVMPSGYKLRLENGCFELDERPESEIVNTAINYFFQSLAHEKKSHAFGIILSGTGTDGVEGVKEIEKFGGTVIVQDPATAQFDGMPQNTIYKDHPDYVVSAEIMPQLIADLQENKGSHAEKRRSY